jgi:hypothetical protein
MNQRTLSMTLVWPIHATARQMNPHTPKIPGGMPESIFTTLPFVDSLPNPVLFLTWHIWDTFWQTSFLPFDYVSVAFSSHNGDLAMRLFNNCLISLTLHALLTGIVLLLERCT